MLLGLACGQIRMREAFWGKFPCLCLWIKCWNSFLPSQILKVLPKFKVFREKFSHFIFCKVWRQLAFEQKRNNSFYSSRNYLFYQLSRNYLFLPFVQKLSFLPFVQEWLQEVQQSWSKRPPQISLKKIIIIFSEIHFFKEKTFCRHLMAGSMWWGSGRCGDSTSSQNRPHWKQI